MERAFLCKILFVSVMIPSFFLVSCHSRKEGSSSGQESLSARQASSELSSRGNSREGLKVYVLSHVERESVSSRIFYDYYLQEIVRFDTRKADGTRVSFQEIGARYYYGFCGSACVLNPAYYGEKLPELASWGTISFWERDGHRFELPRPGLAPKVWSNGVFYTLDEAYDRALVTGDFIDAMTAREDWNPPSPLDADKKETDPSGTDDPTCFVPTDEDLENEDYAFRYDYYLQKVFRDDAKKANGSRPDFADVKIAYDYGRYGGLRVATMTIEEKPSDGEFPISLPVYGSEHLFYGGLPIVYDGKRVFSLLEAFNGGMVSRSDIESLQSKNEAFRRIGQHNGILKSS